MGFGIVFFKFLHDPWTGSPESIDGLIVVPHYEKIVPGLRQKTQHLILHLVDILELVHQDIGKPLLPPLQDIRPGLEQPQAVEEHIFEIDLPHLFLPLLIAFKNAPELFLSAAFWLIFLQFFHPVLHTADLAGQVPHQVFFLLRALSCRKF